jgi:hypothetical protein
MRYSKLDEPNLWQAIDQKNSSFLLIKSIFSTWINWCFSTLYICKRSYPAIIKAFNTFDHAKSNAANVFISIRRISLPWISKRRNVLEFPPPTKTYSVDEATANHFSSSTLGKVNWRVNEQRFNFSKFYVLDDLMLNVNVVWQMVVPEE